MSAVKGLVSIIIPIYNVEKYLRQCVESVLGQTYKDIEVVLIDDGSSDKCPQICDHYADVDPRVNVIHQENGGLSCARNKGLETAMGEYVYFLDSDDYIANNTIEELLNEAKKNDLEVVLFDGYVIDEDGKLDEFNNRYIRKNRYPHVCDGETLFVEMVTKLDYKAAVPFLFIKNNILKNNHLYFYEGIVHEDELFTFLILLECKQAGYLQKRLYYRRIREGSIMSSGCTERKFIGIQTVFKEMIRYYSGREFKPNSVNAIKKHIIITFRSAHNRYMRLSKNSQRRNKVIMKEMFITMKKVNYLNDWRVFIICRTEILYKAYRLIRNYISGIGKSVLIYNL